ncbi:hypothetical protein Efla_000328 [Eimeria flavescens]
MPSKPSRRKVQRLLRDGTERAAKATTAECLKRLPLLHAAATFACKGGLTCVVFEASSKQLQQQQQKKQQHQQQQKEGQAMQQRENQQQEQQEEEEGGLLQQLFALTKKNMQQMYDSSRFMQVGWRDSRKMEELASPEAFFWIVFEGNPATLEEAAGCPLVAFLHFRFEVEEGQPVVYLYELQTQAAFQGLGVGRRLLLLFELKLRELNRELQDYRFDAKTGKTKQITPAATAAAGAASAEEAADLLLLPMQLKKIMCTVLRCNTRAMAFYKEKCRYTPDESCPFLLLQQEQQQQQLAAADSSEEEELPPEYEILKRELSH